MTIDQLILLFPGVSALILSIYQQVSLNKQNKRAADLDDAKNKFSQDVALLEQQRQLINTLQGLMKDQANGGISMQSQLDSLNMKVDQLIGKTTENKLEKEEAVRMLHIHSEEASNNLLRSKEIKLKLDALKPIEKGGIK